MQIWRILINEGIIILLCCPFFPFENCLGFFYSALAQGSLQTQIKETFT